MIKTTTEFRHAVGQMNLMYEALATLQQEVKPKNHQLYTTMAEGPLEEIRRLQAEIEQYLALDFGEEASL
jgi:predicted nucleic acid-binding protein